MRTELGWLGFFCFMMDVIFDHIVNAVSLIIKSENSRCGIGIGMGMGIG